MLELLRQETIRCLWGINKVIYQNLEIIEANATENYILVSGNIPGAKNSLVLIKSAVKNEGKVNNQDELITYVTEEEVTEPVNEVVETEEVATEEVNESSQEEQTQE